MILIGQYVSPFVRRVAITLHHYDLPFERRVLSTYDDFDAMLAISPLGKVPALVLDDGTVLVDSTFIIDHLDSLVAPEMALMPRSGRDRVKALQHVAVGLGLAEKSVEYRTETARRPAEKLFAERVARIARQIDTALDWLESRLPATGWLCGKAMTQADVTVAVAITNLQHKNPELVSAERHGRLIDFTRRCEGLPEFQAVPFSED